MSDAILLPELMRRESRTFLQYARESYPWAHSGKDAELRARLMAMADEENAAIALLGRQLQRRHITLPFLGAFPSSFTNSNFLSISFLVPKLAAAQRQDIGELVKQVPAIAEADLRAQVESYCDLKKRHLQELEALVPNLQAA